MDIAVQAQPTIEDLRRWAGVLAAVVGYEFPLVRIEERDPEQSFDGDTEAMVSHAKFLLVGYPQERLAGALGADPRIESLLKQGRLLEAALEIGTARGLLLDSGKITLAELNKALELPAD